MSKYPLDNIDILLLLSMLNDFNLKKERKVKIINGLIDILNNSIKEIQDTKLLDGLEHLK